MCSNVPAAKALRHVSVGGANECGGTPYSIQWRIGWMPRCTKFRRKSDGHRHACNIICITTALINDLRVITNINDVNARYNNRKLFRQRNQRLRARLCYSNLQPPLRARETEQNRGTATGTLATHVSASELGQGDLTKRQRVITSLLLTFNPPSYRRINDMKLSI